MGTFIIAKVVDATLGLATYDDAVSVADGLSGKGGGGGGGGGTGAGEEQDGEGDGEGDKTKDVIVIDRKQDAAQLALMSPSSKRMLLITKQASSRRSALSPGEFGQLKDNDGDGHDEAEFASTSLQYNGSFMKETEMGVFRLQKTLPNGTIDELS